ncbi:MerR family transcriptional regulator [Pseudonocardia petroleophila]|uniref:MerR family transcriptional regulator n=1 Tax=Pseudonocardia petroleophila TaxID=37331 RepID=A0A7G7MPE2_9PSEU|nr:MerR family transcriptional regulator [Pseudonocardia petroleophila]QNG54653.1 MerR family transcriptional regulator [Pseudonocardia petroleophila]
MRIGELGRRVGVSTRTLRHYESLGLLPARRDGHGHRRYDDADARAVTEIRTLVGLGFALEETRPFVECLRAGHATGGSCPDSIAVYRAKLDEVDAYLARLHDVRAELHAQLNAALLARAPEPRCALDLPEGPR